MTKPQWLSSLFLSLSNHLFFTLFFFLFFLLNFDFFLCFSAVDELCSKTNTRESKIGETDDDDNDDDDEEEEDDTEEREDIEECEDDDDDDDDDISDPFTPDEFVYSKLLCVSSDHDFDTSITSFTQTKSELSSKLQKQLSPSLGYYWTLDVQALCAQSYQ